MAFPPHWRPACDVTLISNIENLEDDKDNEDDEEDEDEDIYVVIKPACDVT